MELFRSVFNPWNQQVLIGVSWVLLYAAIVAGSLFIIGHAIYAAFFVKKETPPSDAEVQRLAPNAPEKVVRHTLVTRVSHWLLAVAVLALLITGFVPILGLKFPWVTIHWIAGLVLAAYTVFHTVHVVARRNLRSMWIGVRDLRETWGQLRYMAGKAGAAVKPGKWGTENKAFHHLTATAGLVVVATGLLMMLRVDTVFAPANPYIFTDAAWGTMFVLHGLAAVVFVGAIMVHIYFALHPDKHWITWSMIRGWISRRDYAWHHDPARWQVAPKTVQLKGVAQRERATTPATPGEL